MTIAGARISRRPATSGIVVCGWLLQVGWQGRNAPSPRRTMQVVGIDDNSRTSGGTRWSLASESGAATFGSNDRACEHWWLVQMRSSNFQMIPLAVYGPAPCSLSWRKDCLRICALPLSHCDPTCCPSAERMPYQGLCQPLFSVAFQLAEESAWPYDRSQPHQGGLVQDAHDVRSPQPGLLTLPPKNQATVMHLHAWPSEELAKDYAHSLLAID
jgi:hypothetical protein